MSSATSAAAAVAGAFHSANDASDVTATAGIVAVAEEPVGQLGDPRLARADDAVGEGALVGEHPGDLLLDGARGQERVDLHHAVLADPECAMDPDCST